jgi:hypothetical protein
LAGHFFEIINLSPVGNSRKIWLGLNGNLSLVRKRYFFLCY